MDGQGTEQPDLAAQLAAVQAERDQLKGLVTSLGGSLESTHFQLHGIDPDCHDDVRARYDRYAQAAKPEERADLGQWMKAEREAGRLHRFLASGQTAPAASPSAPGLTGAAPGVAQPLRGQVDAKALAEMSPQQWKNQGKQLAQAVLGPNFRW